MFLLRLPATDVIGDQYIHLQKSLPNPYPADSRDDVRFTHIVLYVIWVISKKYEIVFKSDNFDFTWMCAEYMSTRAARKATLHPSPPSWQPPKLYHGFEARHVTIKVSLIPLLCYKLSQKLYKKVI
jgi:hypothetical protein